MSEKSFNPFDSRDDFQQRAFWSTLLLILLQSYFLVTTINQLARVNFAPGNPFAYILLTGFILALSTVIIGIVLIVRNKEKAGMNVALYSGFLPAILTPLFYEGRGLAAAITIATISSILIFYVYPPSDRRRLFSYLVGVIGIAALIEIVHPSYRVTLPVSGQFGPISAAIYALLFASVIITQRWFSFKVRTKLLLTTAAILLFSLSLLTWSSTTNIRSQVEIEEQRQLLSLLQNYNSYVKSLEKSAASLAITIADRPDLTQLYEARDRDGVTQLLTPLFNSLKSDFNIVHLYVENPDGTVFVRVHNPTSFGDDITYRQTAAAALKNRQTVAGIEIGPSRLGVRGVTPLLDQGKFIGLIEVGIDYDQNFIDNLKLDTGADYTMWIAYDAAAPAGLKPGENVPPAPLDSLFFYASTFDTRDLAIPANTYKKVMDSAQPELVNITLNGEQYAMIIAPLMAYGDRPIGIFEIQISRAQALTDIRQDQVNLLIFLAFITALGLIAIWFSAQATILRPIETLTKTSEKQLAGDLSARAQIIGTDEFHQLGETLNTLAGNLQESIRGLENRVSERTEELGNAILHSNYRARQYEAVAKVAQATTSLRDLGELLPRVTDLITEQFGYYHAGIFMLDGAKQYAFLTAATSVGGKKMLARGHRLKVGSEGIVGFVTKTMRHRIALDVGQDAIYFNNPDLPETHSEIALPLIVGKEIIGALDVQSTEPNAFSDEDVEVLTILANQVAVAIENTRLFEETRSLLAVAQSSYEGRTSEAWRQTIASRQTIGYKLAGVRVMPLQSPIETPQIREVLETGTSLLEAPDPDSLPTTMTLPIKIRGRSVGVLTIRQVTGKGFNADQVETAKAIIERVGIATEGAILIDESRRRAARETLIGEISAKISAATEFENIMQVAVTELQDALNAPEIAIKLSPNTE